MQPDKNRDIQAQQQRDRKRAEEEKMRLQQEENAQRRSLFSRQGGRRSLIATSETGLSDTLG